MNPEPFMLDQPLLQFRTGARETEGGKDDERNRRQQRDESANRTQQKRHEAGENVAKPDHQCDVASTALGRDKITAATARFDLSFKV